MQRVRWRSVLAFTGEVPEANGQLCRDRALNQCGGLGHGDLSMTMHAGCREATNTSAFVGANFTLLNVKFLLGDSVEIGRERERRIRVSELALRAEVRPGRHDQIKMPLRCEHGILKRKLFLAFHSLFRKLSFPPFILIASL